MGFLKRDNIKRIFLKDTDTPYITTAGEIKELKNGWFLIKEKGHKVLINRDYVVMIEYTLLEDERPL